MLRVWCRLSCEADGPAMHRYNACMSDAGKWLVVVGVILAGIGGVLWGLGRLGFRGLPGDINIESGNSRLYFPITTCLVLSALLTGLFWLWQ